MSTRADERRPVWGLAAFVVASLALIFVTLHMSDIFAEPKKSAATTIGEIAAEIRASAKRALSDGPSPAPEAVSRTWTAERIMLFAGPALAGVATVLGAVGLFLREAPMLPGIAIAMGSTAFLMQFLFWLALLIGGICLLVTIIKNMDAIFGE